MMAARLGLSGLAVGIATAGGVMLYSGYKNATISDTLRALIKNEPVPSTQQATALGAALTRTVGKSLAPATSPDTEHGGGGLGNSIADAAHKYLGVKYSFGGATPGGFDCSGLVTWVLHHDLGIDLPSNTHTVTGQFYIWSGAQTVSSPARGDLVCWTGHIGIYDGGGNMVHAPHTGTTVQVSKVWNTPSPLYRRVRG
jgi:cell wall-associated NlpC family hydrolase